MRTFRGSGRKWRSFPLALLRGSEVAYFQPSGILRAALKVMSSAFQPLG